MFSCARAFLAGWPVLWGVVGAGLGGLLGLLAPSASARAFEVGVGLEGGGSGTIANHPAMRPDGSAPAGAAGTMGGLSLEERFDSPPIGFSLWEDVTTPFALQTGGQVPALYWPLDFGVRSGLFFGRWQPYLGAMGQLAILDHTPRASAGLSTTLFGIGGDVGVDLCFARARVGVEIRAVELVGGILAAPDPNGIGRPLSAFEAQGLLSVRLTL